LLHVTNGDVVAGRLRGAGFDDVLPWREILHEGPVPEGLEDSELLETRARFLASCGWAPYDEARAALEAQGAALAAADEVVLWFERDLFDQLQLVQILAALDETPAALVDLGEPTEQPADLTSLDRDPVERDQRELAAQAWAAFREADPRSLAELAAAEEAALPFLPQALTRLLEELPAVRDGLARSERELLDAVAGGASDRAAAFAAFQRREERPFMGDTVFWQRVDGLAQARQPLLDEEGPLSVTETGEEVLAGRADHVRLNGIDRWLGGVRLAGGEAEWRWDAEAGVVRGIGDG
jgi:hypothetical protein